MLIVAVFLLAGAVVNVGVAWVCAICVFPPQPTGRLIRWDGSNEVRNIRSKAVDGLDYYRWDFDIYPVAGASRFISTWFDFPTRVSGDFEGPFTPDELVPTWANCLRPESPLHGNHHKRIAEARGWPFLAMWAVFATDYDTNIPWPSVAREQVIWGVKLPVARSGDHLGRRSQLVLPLAPISTGFAVNTLFYAAILWLLIPGPFALRRFIRVRRSLCPKCAYPMGESAVCTECGKDLPMRVRPAT